MYVLGHGQLRATACDRLGRPRLAGYRARLHAWPDGYGAKGWPTRTPEYLLHDYHPLLTSVHDLPRLTAYALDRARHQRMLGLVGGRAAGLGEIRAALDVIVGQPVPDLATAL